jgi:hypothetical protein
MQKKFLTTDEITADYGIDAATVQALVDTGDLKALADRGTWKYRREDLNALITSGRLQPTKEMPVVDDFDLDEVLGLAKDEPESEVDYLELDEDALSEQPTIIRGGETSDEPERAALEPWEEALGLVPDVAPSAIDEESASVIDEEVDDDSLLGADDAAEEVASQRVGDRDAAADDVVGEADDSASDANVVLEPMAGSFSDSDIRLGGVDQLAAPASMNLGEAGSDSDLSSLPDAAPTEEIPLEEAELVESGEFSVEDEARGQETLADMPTDWSEATPGAVFAASEDDEDMAIDLDPDSGITLDAGDSGITLDAGDSGISLDLGGDSGIRLVDSGPKLVDPLGKTENQIDFHLEEDERRTVIDPMDQTAVIASLEDSSDQFSPTLSGAIAAGEEVEDLEVSPDLDQDAVSDEIFAEESLDDDEEIAEAADDDFGEEAVIGDDDEELVGAVPGKAARREPGWDMVAFLFSLSAALLVSVNVWLAWSGLQTMWDGSEPPGPAASLVTTIGGLGG